MATEAAPQSAERLESNPYRWYVARFWHGMLLSVWLGLLKRNRFRVGLTRIGLAITISWCAVFNSIAARVQALFYGRRLRATRITEPPLFILGHWRSGTTLLHELLMLDDRFTYPTSYQCFAPNHFLATRWFVTKMTWLLPKKRPMDNVVMGWDQPQEDEFALCNMGIPSPYLTMAFPNEPPAHDEYLDFVGVPAADRERWKQALHEFLRAITLRTPKPIVLKSPPHTGRIEVLLEMFPEAKFVHIVRDPYVLFPSTVRLWKTLSKYQGLQEPKYAGMEEYVFRCFERMYAAFEAQRPRIDSSRFFEVRYEDLVRHPLDEMQALYEKLGLGAFEGVRPSLEAHLAKTGDYRTNKYASNPELEAEINRRWGKYMRPYGIASESAPGAR